MMGDGLILPADSPLVQFRVDRHHKGARVDPTFKFPSVIWVDRANRQTCWRGCKERAFTVPRDIANYCYDAAGWPNHIPYENDPIVCPHQGVFIE